MRMYSQLSKNGNRTATMIEYPDKFRGLIYTYMDKYQFNQKLYDQMMNEWNKHKSGLKVPDEEAKAFFQLESESDGAPDVRNVIQSDGSEEQDLITGMAQLSSEDDYEEE